MGEFKIDEYVAKIAKKIRTYCTAHIFGCNNCALYKYGDCMLNHIPAMWDIPYMGELFEDIRSDARAVKRFCESAGKTNCSDCVFNNEENRCGIYGKPMDWLYFEQTNEKEEPEQEQEPTNDITNDPDHTEKESIIRAANEIKKHCVYEGDCDECEFFETTCKVMNDSYENDKKKCKFDSVIPKKWKVERIDGYSTELESKAYQIKKVCDEHLCIACPLMGDTDCLVSGKPFRWPVDIWLKIVNVEKEPEPTNDITNDPVSHPSHYTRGSIEVADFIADQQLNFDRGNAVKYICRAGHKDKSKEVEDLKKAIWYINHEIDILEGRKPNTTKYASYEEMESITEKYESFDAALRDLVNAYVDDEYDIDISGYDVLHVHGESDQDIIVYRITEKKEIELK